VPVRVPRPAIRRGAKPWPTIAHAPEATEESAPHGQQWQQYFLFTGVLAATATRKHSKPGPNSSVELFLFNGGSWSTEADPLTANSQPNRMYWYQCWPPPLGEPGSWTRATARSSTTRSRSPGAARWIRPLCRALPPPTYRRRAPASDHWRWDPRRSSGRLTVWGGR